jgi:uncharacterized protein (TIGR03435 family)
MTPQFAYLLREELRGGVVVDQTRLKGKYDFHLEFIREPVRIPDGVNIDSLGAILPVVRQQYGLKLATGKGPRKYMVVDHIEGPTEN